MSRPSVLGLVALCAGLAGCGAAPTPPAPVVPAAPAPVAAAPAAPPSLIPGAPVIPPANVPKYEAKGRRDPFVEIQTTTGGGGFSVATTKLTGIVRGPRATLALLETADGLGYILKPGDTLGDGRLMEIGADSVVFAVAAKPGNLATRVVLRLVAN